MKTYYLYILSSQKNGTLYVGITSDLAARLMQHKSGAVKGFTHKYNIKNLVYFEIHEHIDHAILRERQIKRWLRKWKIELIEKNNPYWNDLSNELLHL